MKKIFLILLLCVLLCFCSLESHAKQIDALTRHLHAKFNNKGKIDTTFSEEFQAIDESKILSQVGCTKENDKIEKLPGQPEVGFDQYGGYVTVDEKHGRAFYYYFVEAEESKETKPLLLWLNGGPGCSSLGNGAMEEQGPFRVLSDGRTLAHNPYAWNKVANVIFLESPAWVGFSYSNTSSDINLSGDKITAEDNYVFLLNWLERFPQYKGRDFYLSGESYAGHYVPQLGHTILQHNKKANKNTVNLKGIIIGNALINDETDTYGRYDYWWTHALISDKTIYNIHKYCDFSPNATEDSECSAARADAESSISQGNQYIIDPYAIYAPICLDESLTEEPKKSTIVIDPCSDVYVSAYLNTPKVQEALHAKVTKAGDPWVTCSDPVGNAWRDAPSTILPLLREFLASGLRVWVFSGDTDGILPVTSTRYSLKKLNLRLKEQFRPWFLNEEVGGYTQTYEGNLTFATVRGAGHMVPSHQPQRALLLIKNFLQGIPLPSS